MAKLKISHARVANNDAYDSQLVDRFANNQVSGGNHLGGVGGVWQSVAGVSYPKTIKCSFRTGGTTYDGWIVAQKGARKFRVTDGNVVATCILVNRNKAGLAGAGNGYMSILVTTSTGSFNASKINNKFVWDWIGNASVGRYEYWFAAPTAAGIIPPATKAADGTYAQVASS